MLKYASIALQKPSIMLSALKGKVQAGFFNKKVLRGVELAVTYRCQAKCEKCSCRSLIEEHRREMSLDTIVGVAKEVSGLGAILIDLTGGEPLLRPDIVDIVSELSRLPVIVSMATNGVLLTDPLLERLKKAGLNVLQFGLVSSIASEHDRETGVAGSFDHLMSRIRKARAQNIEVLFNTVITKDLLHSQRMHDLSRLALAHKCFLSLILPAQVGGWSDKDVGLTRSDYLIVKKWLKQKHITIDTQTCYKRGVCPAGTEKVYISAYGDLYPCPFIQKKFGNISNEPFAQIWKRMQAGGYHKCVNICE